MKRFAAILLIVVLCGAAGFTAPVIGPDEVGAPDWGFKVKLPPNWIVAQKTPRLAVLARPGVHGAVVVLPHAMQSMEQLTAKMARGLTDDNADFKPVGPAKVTAPNIIAGDYEGVYDTLHVKARWAASLAPHGGGVIVIVSSRPQYFTKELAALADETARQIQYFDVDYAELTKFFTDTWTGPTPIALGADGTAKGEGYRGRWRVRGNRFEGGLIVTGDDGRQMFHEYRVRTDNGQIFWEEYWIDGKLYSKDLKGK